jgi:putative spermidine/putrescine transport system permease protein
VSVAPPVAQRKVRDPYELGHWLVVAVAVLIVAAMAIPALFVVPVSFSPTRFLTFPPPSLSLRWYETYFTTPEWTESTVYSVVLAVLTTGASLLIGLPAAFGLARGHFRGRQLVTLLIIAPLIVPVILIAIAEYFFMSEINLIGTTPGLVIAHTLLALPFVVIIVTASLRGYDRSYERAAMSMGAGPLRTFWHVTLPLIRPSVISAALFAFLASFGEFLTSLFVIGSTRSTLPIQLWKGIRFETNPTIAAAASMLVGVSLLALLAVELVRWQTRRRSEMRPAAEP